MHMRRASVAVLLALGAAAGCLGGPRSYMTPAAPPAAAPAPRPDGVLAHVLMSPDLDGMRTGDLVGPPGAAPPPRATVLVVFASWCGNCHQELELLAAELDVHPGLRVIGINYRGHEEYDARGNAVAVRRYVHDHAPWLRVVPAGEELFSELGRPPKIPTMYVYDARGALVAVYDRQYRAMPDRGELEQLLARLGV
jgi:thiol-disulfide isomerase/thioredoxin